MVTVVCLLWTLNAGDTTLVSRADVNFAFVVLKLGLIVYFSGTIVQDNVDFSQIL
jgi:hypothetical protein